MKRVSFLAAAAALLIAGAGIAATQSHTAAKQEHAGMGAHASAGKAGTWKGEILDAGCYLAHGAMGEKHKECALKCANNGMPLMMLVNGKAVLLTMDHDNPDPYNSLKAMAGSVAEVTGNLSTRAGVSGIEVTGAKLAAEK
jgi:hypothetical protein